MAEFSTHFLAVKAGSERGGCPLIRRRQPEELSLAHPRFSVKPSWRSHAGIYVDGTSPEVGTPVGLPRRIGDPLGSPRGDGLSPWPGEVDFIFPPGSIALFDTALWHAAKAGTRPRIRRLFGAHHAPWNSPRPHLEDNPCDVPEVAEYKKRDPLLRALLERSA